MCGLNQQSRPKIMTIAEPVVQSGRRYQKLTGSYVRR